MDNIENIFQKLTAGASIDAWDTTYLPPEEWAGSIFEDAVREASLLPTIMRRYDSTRKITVPVQTITTPEWQTSVSGDVHASGSVQYDATGIALDPAEYRTYMPIARKSLDEATWSVERDVRYRLSLVAAEKIDQLIWQTLDGTAIGTDYKYGTAGESFTNTTTGNAVDYGTQLTVDNVIDAIYNVRNTSHNFFKPNTAVVSPAMMKGLIKESPLLSAAERGNNQVAESGIFTHFLGLDFVITYAMQDSGSTEVGLVYDKNFYFIGNLPKEFEIATDRIYNKDQIGFYVKIKAAFSVGDSEAGAVLYT
jgi:HK97 family phage major capsid protein